MKSQRVIFIFQPEASGCRECFFRGDVAFDLVVVRAETHDV